MTEVGVSSRLKRFSAQDDNARADSSALVARVGPIRAACYDRPSLRDFSKVCVT